MITEDGFMKHDYFLELLKDAEVIEIICPKCKLMTCTQDLGDDYWLCVECGTVFETC